MSIVKLSSKSIKRPLDQFYLNARFSIVFSDYVFKILIIGDAGGGKSCLILRFAV